MCTICQALDPSSRNFETHVQSGSGGTPSSVESGLPTYDYDTIATYLTNGFWQDFGGSQRSFDVQSGGTLTYDISGLTAFGQETALKAFEAWTAVSGLQFQQVSGSADLTFDDNQSGAFAQSWTSGNTIVRSTINVHSSWSSNADYYYQTYMHEIGHALGLGHTGDYNGNANYGTDAHFANDSWQTSVMSYFSQNENTTTTASFAYLATLSLGDIAAIHSLYGTPVNVRADDTTYGDNHNTGLYNFDLPGQKMVTIFDSGGTDHINLESRTSSQRIDLNQETFSDINGKIGNFAIARNTVIENVTTGSGADTITGNDDANRIITGSGNDVIFAAGGDDVIVAGGGVDEITGGAGADRHVYTALSDGGDTITDFALSAGDRIDLRDLFTAISYSGSDPVGDGIVYLTAGSGGSWLMVDADGPGGSGATQLVFLEGVSDSTSVADIINVDGSTPVGPTDPNPEDPVDPGEPTPTGGADTTYVFTNEFIDGWTAQRGTIDDTDGGTDTLDFSAGTLGTRVYLDNTRDSKFGSRNIIFEDGEQIENILFADKSDRGYGNLNDNLFEGMGGHDKLYGRAGDDTLDGGDGNDRIYGEDDDDLLIGGAGNDDLRGGDGNDVLDAGDGRDKLIGGAGDDTLSGGEGADQLRGQDGDDVVDGGVGRDRIYGNDGNDTLDGGDDADMIYGDDGNDSIDGGAGLDKLYGGDGDDLISGGADRDMIKGGDGADTIDGGDGDDRIFGDDGNDVISGGAGNDNIMVGKGVNEASGGAGDDRIIGGREGDMLFGDAGADDLRGSAGDDSLSGGDGADRLSGDQGNDEILGGTGSDRISSGSGSDTVDGGADDDSISAGSGDDLILGGDGADQIDAGSGDDVILGGIGADIIKGGSGSDVFVFSDLSEAGDHISDFSLRRDDMFEISDILADIGLTTQQAVDTDAVYLIAEGRSSWLMIDTDGAGSGADTQLALLKNMRSTTEVTEDWFLS